MDSVIEQMKNHGDAHLDYEVCGVLVGNICLGPDNKWFVSIEDRIEGKHAQRLPDSVTFTSETWDFINDQMSEKFPNRRIVGWYHTHPGFGIFLSNMDMHIHGNFFNLPWQCAYVYDPIRKEDGWFLWEGKNAVKDYVEVVHSKQILSTEQINAADECNAQAAIEDNTDMAKSKSDCWHVALQIVIVTALILLGALQYLSNKKIERLDKSPQTDLSNEVSSLKHDFYSVINNITENPRPVSYF